MGCAVLAERDGLIGYRSWLPGLVSVWTKQPWAAGENVAECHSPFGPCPGFKDCCCGFFAHVEMPKRRAGYVYGKVLLYGLVDRCSDHTMRATRARILTVFHTIQESE